MYSQDIKQSLSVCFWVAVGKLAARVNQSRTFPAMIHVIKCPKGLQMLSHQSKGLTTEGQTTNDPVFRLPLISLHRWSTKQEAGLPHGSEQWVFTVNVKSFQKSQYIITSPCYITLDSYCSSLFTGGIPKGFFPSHFPPFSHTTWHYKTWSLPY